MSAKDAEGVAQDIDARIGSLRDPGAAAKRKSMESELRELNARVLLGKHEQTLLDEIERKKKIAAFGQWGRMRKCSRRCKPPKGARTQSRWPSCSRQ